MASISLTGGVVTGQGQGAGFTQLEWVQQQFIQKLGIEPYPGTLNLRLEAVTAQTQWQQVKTQPGVVISPPEPTWCEAHCYPIQLPGNVPAAIVVPAVPDYPPDQVEIIAALPLRDHLGVADGDALSLTVSPALSVQAVIFDVDGTMLDSVRAFVALAQTVGEPHGLVIKPEIVRHALNINTPKFWDLVVPASQPNRSDFMDTLQRESLGCWPDILQEYGALFPQLKGTLTTLKRYGLRLGIVTGSSGGSLVPLREAGLLDFFGCVVTAKDVERRKPDPEGLLKCAAALGVAPAHALYVGDTVADIQASRAAGMAVVTVLTGAADSALLAAAGPDRVIYSQADLLDILAVG